VPRGRLGRAPCLPVPPWVRFGGVSRRRCAGHRPHRQVPRKADRPDDPPARCARGPLRRSRTGVDRHPCPFLADRPVRHPRPGRRDHATAGPPGWFGPDLDITATRGSGPRSGCGGTSRTACHPRRIGDRGQWGVGSRRAARACRCRASGLHSSVAISTEAEKRCTRKLPIGLGVIVAVRTMGARCCRSGSCRRSVRR
jgi:hypothetical protein